jgi:phosphatidylcholine synthase
MPSSAAKRGRIRAWLVHGYTASGAVLALAGARAVTAHDARLAFAAMFLATLVDATDGVLARRANVKGVLPQIDGGRIDDLVDYLNFVFLPVFLVLEFGMLPERLGWPIAAAVLLASLYGFVAPDAKTADHFFTGFPSYWNIVVLYLFVLRATPAVAAGVLIVLVGLVFVRIGYVYPSRMTVLRTATVVLASLWGALLAVIIWRLPRESFALAILSLLFPVYYMVLSLLLNARRTA